VDLAGLSRRTADNWRPLFAIAEALAGDWPDLARKAAKELTSAKRVSDEEVKVQLLSDLRDLFGGRERMHSADIVKGLVALEDRAWAEWGRQKKPISKTALAGLLRDFKVPSAKSMEIDGKNLKGYEREWLEPLFKRYLAPGGDHETSSRQEPHGVWDPRQHSNVKSQSGSPSMSTQTTLPERAARLPGSTAALGRGVTNSSSPRPRARAAALTRTPHPSAGR